MQGTVFDIGEGTIHDGPGLRITVFLKGCPLRCAWCHSPEGQTPEPEVLKFSGMPDRRCGKIWESGDLAAHLASRAALMPSGGITFSGGEPLLQGAFLNEVIDRLGSRFHLLIDSCGFADEALFLTTVRKVNCVYFGLKLLNDADALKWTRRPAAPVLRNLLLLDRETDTPYHLRIPLLAGVTGSDEYLKALMAFSRKLHRAGRIDFLPSNPEAGAKYHSCGREFSPGFDVQAKYEIPGWFRPAIPFRLFNANEVE